jgi:sterol desaturase/sphingolipid hydroxylase (fatty acid hydroxylase superfamily)
MVERVSSGIERPHGLSCVVNRDDIHYIGHYIDAQICINIRVVKFNNMNINGFIISEPSLRAMVFMLMCAVMLAWEHHFPRRKPSRSKRWRWINNFSLAAINTAIVRIGFPTTAYSLALFAQDNQWGLLNHTQLPIWLTIVMSVLLLDLVIYLQHRVFHGVPVLWRLHRMHHSDVDIDASTGIRFHPLEILLSFGIKMGVIVVLGAPATAVVVFEILLNATSLFNHGNVVIPKQVDKLLRWFVVTPDMHRVHHSVDVKERNQNFGFNLPWWDYMFATYQDQPADGHRQMTIGLKVFRNKDDIRFMRLLVQPFRTGSG